jgi:hypothetical protein
MRMISVEFFKGLPLEYESFLIEKYDSFMTTCRYIEIYYSAHDINYLIVKKEGILIELLVFGNIGQTCTCFNSLVNIDQSIVDEFIKNVFQTYPFLQKIIIGASYNCYRFNNSFLSSSTNDHILFLPSNTDEYYLSLGSKLRRNLKSSQTKLLRDFPQVNFVTVYGDEIEQGVISMIIHLNIERMKQKGVVPGKNGADIQKIYDFSRHYGCVAYIEIDGKLIAGNICYVLNNRIFGHVIAHDNDFSSYNVGYLCQLHLIQTLIEKGLSKFHFLWGNSEYKIRLQAKPHSLFSYHVHRSYSFILVVNKWKAKFSRLLIRVRNSTFVSPVRSAIKYYRRNGLKQ